MMRRLLALARERAGERRRARLARLVAEGRTVELTALAGRRPRRVVEIDLRFGPELWAIWRDEVLVETGHLDSLTDGALVVSGDEPVRRAADVRALGLPVTHEVVRFAGGRTGSSDSRERS